MHVRIQSWMPFPLQIYINGHSWLARKMDRPGIGYHRLDNAFSHIDDRPQAQRFAAHLAHKNWPRVLGWFPMAKRGTNLPRYFEIGQAACAWYAQALAEVDDPRRAYEKVHRLTRPCCRQGRQVHGLNPLRTEDAALFEAVLRGEYLLHGLRKGDLVARLYPTRAASKALARRRSRRVTRLLHLLWVHGLIAKIPRSRRWRVTGEGRRLMSSTIVLRHVDIPAQLTAIPA